MSTLVNLMIFINKKMEDTSQKNIMTYEMMDDYVINVLGMKPTTHDGDATVYRIKKLMK